MENKLGVIEGKFADIIWNNAPITKTERLPPWLVEKNFMPNEAPNSWKKPSKVLCPPSWLPLPPAASFPPKRLKKFKK